VWVGVTDLFQLTATLSRIEVKPTDVNQTPPSPTPRAHYACAQVSALTGDWPAAEAAYTRCAAAAAAPAPDPQIAQIAGPASDASDYSAFLGQALFCVGTARARQGRGSEALAAYSEAEAAGYPQPHALAQARGAALLALGRPGEALAVVRRALDGDGGAEAAAAAAGGGGFVDMTPVLRDLLGRIEERIREEEGRGRQE
jgi:hypothetical protein